MSPRNSTTICAALNEEDECVGEQRLVEACEIGSLDEYPCSA